MSENQARVYFRQIIHAVHYCNSLNIVHRDLKPENILIAKDSYIKISGIIQYTTLSSYIDFGFSSLVSFQEARLLHTTCGTLNYIAPEIIKNCGYDGHLADIWSCGVILYFCITARNKIIFVINILVLPFEDESLPKLLDKIVLGSVTFPKFISREAKDLLSRIFVTNPSKRLTIDEIISHPWFTDTKLLTCPDSPAKTSLSFQLPSPDKRKSSSMNSSFFPTENSPEFATEFEKQHKRAFEYIPRKYINSKFNLIE